MKKFKPLIRWTAGNMSPEGIECLIHSVNEWTKNYGDTFDKMICFNGEIPSEISSLNIDIINQKKYNKTLLHEPYDSFWKFYPPRIRPDSHEIIIDNDLVIHNKSFVIQNFLNSYKNIIVSAAHKHFYGQFESILEPGILVNTGFIGLPPFFDLRKKLNAVFMLYPFKKLRKHCDDQGAFICAVKKCLEIIPMEQIYACNPQISDSDFKLGEFGTHFVGLNQGHISYWNKYKKISGLK